LVDGFKSDRPTKNASYAGIYIDSSSKHWPTVYLLAERVPIGKACTYWQSAYLLAELAPIG